jgi:hypothetical protein
VSHSVASSRSINGEDVNQIMSQYRICVPPPFLGRFHPLVCAMNEGSCGCGNGR